MDKHSNLQPSFVIYEEYEERPAMDKHSNLLCSFLIYAKMKCCENDPKFQDGVTSNVLQETIEQSHGSGALTVEN
jgi:hypothetical protein